MSGRPTDIPLPESAPDRLEGWKAIAAHLNRDVRTAKRWEVSEALPVHRHQHHARSSVYAYVTELDRWRVNRRPESAESTSWLAKQRRVLVLAPAMAAALLMSGGGRVFEPLGVAAAQTGAANSLIWDSAVGLDGTVSADGQWLSFVDWETGDIALRDLTTGQNRRVTNKGGYTKALGEGEATALSADGRGIAFTWDRWDAAVEPGGRVELRVIAADGSNERVLLDGENSNYLEPKSWSPDGRWIAVVVERDKGKGDDVVLVSRDGAQTRTIATLPDRGPGRVWFSPDGQWLAFDRPAADSGTPTGDVSLVRADGSGQATSVIADAALAAWTPDGRNLLFSRARQGVQDLYEVSVANGQVGGDSRPITAATDMGASLGMTRSGSLFYAKNRRTTDAVLASYDAMTGQMGAPQVVGPVTAIGLFGGGGNPKISPDGRTLCLVAQSTTIVLHDLADGRERTIVPALASLRAVDWAPDSRSLIVAGVARDGTDAVFKVDPAAGTTSILFKVETVRILAASPDGHTIYYRANVQSTPVMAHDLISGTERKVFDWLGALPAMSVSRDGRTLALTGSFSLVFVDVATGQAQTRWRTPAGADAEKIQWGAWTPGDKAFVALWASGRAQELRTFPVAGDAAPLRDRLTQQFRGVSLSPDGTQMSLMRWANLQQLWSLQSFLPAPAR